MNKKLVIIGTVSVCIVLIVILLIVKGAGGGIAGSYKLADVSGTGSEMFKATVGDAVLEIASDDTGTFSMLDQKTPVVVNEKDKKISFDGGENYSSYTLEGKKLTVEKNGYKAVFKK